MFSRVEVGRRGRVLTYFAAATNKIDISRYVPNVMIEDWLWLIPSERLSSFCVQNCTKLVRNLNIISNIPCLVKVCVYIILWQLCSGRY